MQWKKQGVEKIKLMCYFVSNRNNLPVSWMKKTKRKQNPSLKSNLYLVTGGCGFVGRHLVRKLLTIGNEVWIIDDLSTGKHPDFWLGPEFRKISFKNNTLCYQNDKLQKIYFIYGDVVDVFSSEIKGEHILPDFSDVFHLASIVGGRELIDGDPVLVAKDLAIDSIFFLWATRRKEKIGRILYASSSAAYPIDLQGEREYVALKEEMIKFDGRLGQPDMTYGWSKLTGEYLSRLAASRYGLSVACIRPFSGYGEDQDLTYPVPAIARRVALRENPLTVWGTGKQGRDFVHIDDCVEAFFLILENIHDGSGCNIGSGEILSFLDVLNIFTELEGYSPTIQPLMDKPTGVVSRHADASFIKGLGWEPKISYREGFGRTLNVAKSRLLQDMVSFIRMVDGFDTERLQIDGLNKSEFFVNKGSSNGAASVRPIEKVLLITSINPPRKEVEEFAKLEDWTLVCVGDLKTPHEKWNIKNVVYLSPETQDRLFPEFSRVHPWNRYTRKNMGYLYSVRCGAKVICETDDDVFFYKNFPPKLAENKTVTVLSGRKFINIYSFYNRITNGEIKAWPRGFPLNYIKDQNGIKKEKRTIYAPMQNSVIDKDSDFDVIYRLLDDRWVKFKKEGEYALAKGSYCPVNTQNTFTFPAAYPLLYLPAYANFHCDDIISRYIAQRLLWEIDANILFTYPTAYTSDRNVHNYMKDFEIEIPLFTQINKLIDILDSLSLSKDFTKSLIKIYEEVIKQKILPKEELEVVKSWVKEIDKSF